MANNIISIILGGKLILIEGVANEKLKRYLTDVSNFYVSDADKNSKVLEVENRLGLLFYQKLQSGTPYINIEDVAYAISQEPIPEGFTASQSGEGHNTHFSDESYYRKKLYRNDSDKKLGGVCSGIAHWLNIDANIVRILVAVIILSSIGFGLLLYIAAWIFLPTKYLGQYQGKILFRNPDNKIFGGVCSGIAAYFKTSVNTVRLITAAPLILSILKGIRFFNWGPDLGNVFGLISGFFTGFTITTYIILWIVLPEAITFDQKKNMYSSFKKNNAQFEHGMNDIKEKMTNWGNEAKESMQNMGKQFQQNTEHINKNIPNYGRSVGEGIGAVIGGIFKAIFFVLVGTVAVSLFLILISMLFSGIAWSSINNYLWTSDTQMYLAWGTLILFLVVPVIGLFVWLYRRISGGRSLNNNHFGWSFGGLWALGWVLLIFFIADVSKEFKYKGNITQEHSFTVSNNKPLILKVNQPELVTNSGLRWSSNDVSGAQGIFFDEDSLKLGIINLQYEKSEDSLYHIVLIKQAMGSSNNDATARAQNTVFNYSIKDSLLDLPNGLAIAKNNAYRMQNITMLVKIPVGKSIVMDESVMEKLENVNVGFNQSRHRNSWNNLSMLMANEEYEMQDNGALRNLEIQLNKSEISAKNNKGYRWKGSAEAVDSTAVSDTLNATDNGYRFNQDSARFSEKQKKKLVEEIELKQKELDELKEKIKNQQ